MVTIPASNGVGPVVTSPFCVAAEALVLALEGPGVLQALNVEVASDAGHHLLAAGERAAQGGVATGLQGQALASIDAGVAPGDAFAPGATGIGGNAQGHSILTDTQPHNYSSLAEQVLQPPSRRSTWLVCSYRIRIPRAATIHQQIAGVVGMVKAEAIAYTECLGDSNSLNAPAPKISTVFQLFVSQSVPIRTIIYCSSS